MRCLAVAGFAAANVMLLSVSVWSGNASDMDPATRDLFHWVSALIALPAVAYAGRPFFFSAWSALRHGAMNMDVPISLGVLLASASSLFETMHGATHVYFDASVTLLFFLLCGRYLDRQARAKARSAAEHLLALTAIAATVLEENGDRRSVPVAALRPGMRVDGSGRGQDPRRWRHRQRPQRTRQQPADRRIDAGCRRSWRQGPRRRAEPVAPAASSRDRGRREYLPRQHRQSDGSGRAGDGHAMFALPIGSPGSMRRSFMLWPREHSSAGWFSHKRVFMAR